MSGKKSIVIRFPQGQPDDYEYAPSLSLRGIRMQLRRAGITIRRVPRQPSFEVRISTDITLYPEDLQALLLLGCHARE